MNIHKVEFLGCFGTADTLPVSNKPEIAFVGRSNVGKSSLINKLFNRKQLAKVSSKPGKTQTINFFSEGSCNFVDLPGYGYAAVGRSHINRWSNLINAYFKQDRNFACLVSLIDIRHKPTKLDHDMVNYLFENELPFIIVLTKADKLSKAQRDKQIKLIRQELDLPTDFPILPVSSQTGLNINELIELFDEIIQETNDVLQ